MSDFRNDQNIEEADLIAHFDDVLDSCERGQTWLIEREGKPVAVLLPYTLYTRLPGETEGQA